MKRVNGLYALLIVVTIFALSGRLNAQSTGDPGGPGGDPPPGTPENPFESLLSSDWDVIHLNTFLDSNAQPDNSVPFVVSWKGDWQANAKIILRAKSIFGKAELQKQHFVTFSLLFQHDGTFSTKSTETVRLEGTKNGFEVVQAPVEFSKVFVGEGRPAYSKLWLLVSVATGPQGPKLISAYRFTDVDNSSYSFNPNCIIERGPLSNLYCLTSTGTSGNEPEFRGSLCVFRRSLPIIAQDPVLWSSGGEHDLRLTSGVLGEVMATDPVQWHTLITQGLPEIFPIPVPHVKAEIRMVSDPNNNPGTILLNLNDM